MRLLLVFIILWGIVLSDHSYQRYQPESDSTHQAAPQEPYCYAVHHDANGNAVHIMGFPSADQDDNKTAAGKSMPSSSDMCAPEKIKEALNKGSSE